MRKIKVNRFFLTPGVSNSSGAPEAAPDLPLSAIGKTRYSYTRS